jgi:D-tyrosyl-tRNA(Tyr) deacylase
MLGLIQRVTSASVQVDGQDVGRVDRGLLLLLGIQKDDDESAVLRMLDKVLAYRVFPDEQGHMNLSVTDIGGGLLIVSQFTLAADTKKGLRPSFSKAAPPEVAEPLYDQFVYLAQEKHGTVGCGRFGADMQVQLVNDGPVTFLLEVSS